MKFLLAFCAIAMGVLASPNIEGMDPFIEQISAGVVSVIDHSEDAPGLQSGWLESHRADFIDRWNEVVEAGVLEVSDTDEQTRPYFVGLQAIVEYTLALGLHHGEIASLTGVIHTPMPATPLCTTGDISGGLVDPEVEQDDGRAFTVQSRAQIIRHYLAEGGSLYVVYPEGGLEKRSQQQREIYRAEVQAYSTLFDRPINCGGIEVDQTGAFYVFTNQAGRKFAFAIKMTQANNLQRRVDAGLWFGEYREGSPVFDRISDVLKTIPLDLVF